MSPTRQAYLVRRVLIAAWGMTTVVLVFAVVFLTAALVKGGGQEAVSGRAPQIPAPLVRPPGDEMRSDKDVALYFADARYGKLAPEVMPLRLGDETVENCRAALEALIGGPKSGLKPTLPPTTQIRGIFLMDDGELVINFSIELELEARKMRSAAYESLLVYSVVNTLAQPVLKGSEGPAVSKVRLLIEDGVPRESFPAHIDATGSFVPNADWVTPLES